MTAIVEEDEDAYQQGGSRHRERKSNPVGIPSMNRNDHQRPDSKIRNKGVEDLMSRFSAIRLYVLVDGLSKLNGRRSMAGQRLVNRLSVFCQFRNLCHFIIKIEKPLSSV